MQHEGISWHLAVFEGAVPTIVKRGATEHFTAQCLQEKKTRPVIC